MSSNPAIRISGLSKSYQIAHNNTQRPTNLGEAITQRLRNPFKRTEKETFWALKDIDLEIQRGEIVGVIGRNGAGKSTLLKILSRITEPTTGRIELFGRVGSLLEVGTGFHPELTGRENIFLNGAILGMKRSEIRRQFDEIIDFAGVEKFLDTPVKRYSSGMYVRLAFAVAAHLNPEILIIDEVLAVGDAEFQKKCLGKMQDVAQSGRTVIFVSHNMAAVSNLCTKGVLLEHGSVTFSGDLQQTIGMMHSLIINESISTYSSHQDILGQITFSVGPTCGNPAITVGAPLRFTLTIESQEVIRLTRIGIGIDNSAGFRVCTLFSDGDADSKPRKSGYHYVTIDMTSPVLLPGLYSIKLAMRDGAILLAEIDPCLTFEVLASDTTGSGRLPNAQQGSVLPIVDWKWKQERSRGCSVD